jgi:chemotaxis protein MotB
MIFKKLPLFLLVGITLSSCVTRKLYNDLDQQYQNALKENERLNSDLELLNTSNTDLEQIKKQLADQLKDLQQERSNLNAEIITAQNRLKDLEDSYTNLEKHSEETLKAEASRLAKAKSELEEKANRVLELENILAANDRQMKTLKDNLAQALNDFEGRGLSIEQKMGGFMYLWKTNFCSTPGAGSSITKGKKQL